MRFGVRPRVSPTRSPHPANALAAHGGRDVRISQRETIVSILRRREVGESGAMERSHQEVAGSADAVSGEDAARTVRAVRRRRKTNDQQARQRIAESRNRPAPVDVIAIGAPLRPRNVPAVCAQTRAASAGSDLFLYFLQSCYRDLLQAHQTRHAFFLTIGASALHENARANSGMLETTPFTRCLGGACGSVCASMR